MSAEPVVFSYGSTDHQSETNGYVLELTVKEESFSIEKNTSQVSYTLKLISGGSNRFILHYTGAAVWLNGIQVGYRDRWTSPQVSLEYNSSVVLLSDTVTVHHSADGSCTMPVVFSIEIEINAYTPGPQTASGQMSLSVMALHANSHGTRRPRVIYCNRRFIVCLCCSQECFFNQGATLILCRCSAAPHARN